MKHTVSLMRGKWLAAVSLATLSTLCGYNAHAQTAVVQSFNGTNVNNDVELGFDGNPTIRSGTARNGETNGPDNTKPVGSPFYAPSVNPSGSSSSWGITNATEGVLFRGRQTSAGSTGNYIQFRLAAWGLTSNEGLDGGDEVNVFVSVDNGQNYVHTLRIKGKEGGEDGYWDFTSGASKVVDYNATRTEPFTIGPANNEGAGQGNRNLNGSGYDNFRINIPNGLQYIRFYIVANCGRDELWTIDEVTVGSSSSSPLPVELKSFTAALGTAGTQLRWETATEQNNATFEVQRGATAEKFETIGRVDGQGTSSHGHRYQWMDARPLAGVSYYRLRQLDYDGTEAFSPIVVVQNKEELISAIFPNPTTGLMALPASLGAVKYRVLNNLGQTMLSGETTGGNTMDMQSLREGTYFLEVNSSTGRSVQRFVKSR